MPKPLTVWITINCGKFWKRWAYQITWPASWETYMQVRKQQDSACSVGDLGSIPGSGRSPGEGQFSFQSQRKAMPKNAPTTAQFVYYHSSKISIVFCLCFVNKFPLYHFLDSTYRWYHVILIFVWLTSLSLIISRFIHVATNDIISFF